MRICNRLKTAAEDAESSLSAAVAAQHAAAGASVDMRGNIMLALQRLKSSLVGVVEMRELKEVVHVGAESEGAAMEEVEVHHLGDLLHGVVDVMARKLAAGKEALAAAEQRHVEGLLARDSILDQLSGQVRDLEAKVAAGGDRGGGGAGGSGLWSESEVEERVARLRAMGEREAEEEQQRLKDAFDRERQQLESEIKSAREQATEALQRKDVELQEANVWAKELGQEAAELRTQIRHMQTKLTEQQNLVREAREEAKQLRAKLALLPAARLAPAIADFRRSLQSFRGGLSSCKEDVVGVLAAARQDLEMGVGRELVGFVKMVMPLAHVDAPLVINTDKLSRQQLSTAVRHSLGKYREAEVRACQLNAALQDAKGCVRVMCRFAPPLSSLHVVSPTLCGGGYGELGQEEGDRQRGRGDNEYVYQGKPGTCS